MHGYEEVGTAGEGAYGLVLKCRSRASGELVAVKRFRELESEDAEAARVMQREIDILRSLRHENIVEMRDVFRDQGVLHIVFEYVEECLVGMLDARPAGLGSDLTRRLTSQLARAVGHCHDRGVVHRDVKPDNVLVSARDGSVRLCDFGSACRLVPGGGPLTDYAATRWYRAPELLVRFDDYGPGVDVWALGCVAAEMLTGRPLFPGKSDLDQLFMIQDALGPLTPRQAERCLDLTGFVRFPEVAERQTLEKRLGHAASEEEARFLSRALVVDPSERVTAKTALSTAWLRVGAGGAAGHGRTDGPRDAPEAESVSSCWQPPPAPREASQDFCDATIEESVLEESIMGESVREEDCVSHGADEAAASAMVATGGSVGIAGAAARGQVQDGVALGGRPAEGSAASGGESQSPAQRESCEESIEEDGVVMAVSSDKLVGESLAPVEEEGVVRTVSTDLQGESLAPVEECLVSQLYERCDGSVREEVEIDDSCWSESSHTTARPAPVPRLSQPLAGRDGIRLCAQHPKPHIRPVSKGSARSSLTPMS